MTWLCEGYWLAAALKKGAQEVGSFDFEQSASGRKGVIETGIGGKVVESAGGAGFGVRGSVDQAAYTSGVESAGAHGTGL